MSRISCCKDSAIVSYTAESRRIDYVDHMNIPRRVTLSNNPGFATDTFEVFYMANTSVWEEAWNRAQPRLSSIRNALNPHDSPDLRIIRVGQLDSELLDQELVQLLQEPLNSALSLINVCQKTIRSCVSDQSYSHTGFLKSAV